MTSAISSPFSKILNARQLGTYSCAITMHHADLPFSWLQSRVSRKTCSYLTLNGYNDKKIWCFGGKRDQSFIKLGSAFSPPVPSRLSLPINYSPNQARSQNEIFEGTGKNLGGNLKTKQKKRLHKMKSWFWPQITRWKQNKKSLYKMKSWFSPQIRWRPKKSLHWVLKADSTSNWLTQDIWLRKNDV